MSVLMVFIDGIGIGQHDKNRNPLARYPSTLLSHFSDHPSEPVPHDGRLVPTDPSMGLPGLPQSATGQTALLTGVNASKALGHHQSGFPSPTLRRIILESSIFREVERMTKTATFANAFTPEYFTRPDRRISATTWAVRASNFPFRMVEKELWQDQAISHDLTNSFLSKQGYDVPTRTAKQSAEILVEISHSVDFCLFEFILTDMVGHSRDFEMASTVVNLLHEFLQSLLEQIDLQNHLVLLTSDHGNFEDLGVATHTRNFVPTFLWGRGQDLVASSICRIQDVPRAILAYLEDSP